MYRFNVLFWCVFSHLYWPYRFLLSLFHFKISSIIDYVNSKAELPFIVQKSKQTYKKKNTNSSSKNLL